MDTTIAAISTAYGEAGIGIIRMSGPEALNIAKKIFTAKSGHTDFLPRMMSYGNIVDPSDGAILDEALCVYMKAPHTYTAEDIIEIQCHGSLLSQKAILSLCLKEGAVLAEPGEFTKRAFLNGRMDLSEAEAVIDLIKAKTSEGFDVALSQMQGRLSEEVHILRKMLLDSLVELTVNMDYPDEDIEVLTYEKFKSDINAVNSRLDKLLSHAGEGKLLREGIKACIIGKPNVGKSSLLNYFLGENRAIVTSVAGTTRDTVEEQANIRGIPITFIDTAGIHDSSDLVESIGIEKSKEAFNKADLVLLVLDASESLSEEDKKLLSMIEGRTALVVLNKTDLEQKLDESLLSSYNVIKISVAEGSGVEALKDSIEKLIGAGGLRRTEDIVINNVRHENLLNSARIELFQALQMIDEGEAMDFIEVNVHAAYDFLGEIIGETAGEQVIDEVFSRFCLGK